MVFIAALFIIGISLVVYKTSKKYAKNNESKLAFIGVGVGAVIAVLQIFTVVPAGMVGVVDFFGNVNDNTLRSGVNIVNPFANVVKFSIKTQEVKETMNVPSMEGLPIQLEISLLYSLDPVNASKIYKTVGEDYAEIILVPQFRSVVRGVTSKYDAKALYTASREKLAAEIKDELENLVGPRGITIESAPMRQITLPSGLTASIEEKLKAYVPEAEVVKLESMREYFKNSNKLDALLLTAQRGSAWSLIYPDYSVAVPKPDIINVPLAYAMAPGDQDMANFISTWIELKKEDGTIDKLYNYWILGESEATRKPRWSIIRNVLHWTD